MGEVRTQDTTQVRMESWSVPQPGSEPGSQPAGGISSSPALQTNDTPLVLGLRDIQELQIAYTDQQNIALKGFIFNDFLLNPGCVFRRTVLADQCSGSA